MEKSSSFSVLLLLLYAEEEEEEEEAVRRNASRRRRLKTVKPLAFVFVKNASAQKEVVLKRTVSVRFVVLTFLVFFCSSEEEEALKKVVLMVPLLEEIIIVVKSVYLCSYSLVGVRVFHRNEEKKFKNSRRKILTFFCIFPQKKFSLEKRVLFLYVHIRGEKRQHQQQREKLLLFSSSSEISFLSSNVSFLCALLTREFPFFFLVL